MADSTSVQVVVRLRPMNQKELKGNTLPVVSASTEKKEVTVIKGSGARQQRSQYGFDNVFTSFSTQEEVFIQTLAPVIPDVLAGFECTMFAYGQTGTGKTHTMEGDLNVEAERGIIPRSAQDIFERLRQPEYLESSVTASYLEIYNEELSDLLIEPTGRESKLMVVEDASKKGKGVFVQNLSEQVVTTAEDVHDLMNLAQERRKIGETKMNKASSRSHCLFTLKVHSKKQADSSGAILECAGKLHLVDLAGSECAKSAGTDDAKIERERKNINQSLLTLGRVISSLRESNSQRIPYRDSKLTRLLQESLGGRCKTVIIATVSPSVLSVEETTSTLNYAQAAHGIQNKPVATSYLKVGDPSRPTAPTTSASGAMVQDWSQLECRLTYLQQELDEAQAALSRKHLQQQSIIDRAEAAESQRDAFAKDIELAKEAVVQQKKRCVDLSQQLSGALTEVEKRDLLISVRTGTEQSLSAEAHALLDTVKKSTDEGTRLHLQLTTKAEEDATVRDKTKGMRSGVEAGLNGLAKGVDKMQADVCVSGDEGVKAVTVCAVGAKKEMRSMLSTAENMSSSVVQAGESAVGEARKQMESASASLSEAVQKSASSADCIVARVQSSGKESREGISESVQHVRNAESSLSKWVEGTKASIAECVQELHATREALKTSVGTVRDSHSERLEGLLGELRTHMEMLGEIGVEIGQHNGKQQEHIKSLKALSTKGDSNQKQHVEEIAQQCSKLSETIEAQRNGQKDKEALATLDEARESELARTEAESSALSAHEKSLNEAVTAGESGMRDKQLLEVVGEAEEALQEGHASAHSHLKEQKKNLNDAGDRLETTNAEKDARADIALTKERSAEGSASEVSVLACQQEVLAAVSARLSGLKQNETTLLVTLDAGHIALLERIAEQDTTLKAQAAKLEEQGKLLEDALQRQKAGQQELVRSVMGGLENILSQQISLLSSTIEQDVSDLSKATESALRSNKTACSIAQALSSAATEVRGDADAQVKAWGVSCYERREEVDSASELNAKASEQISSLDTEVASHMDKLDQRVASWGDANRNVGESIASAVESNNETAQMITNTSVSVHDRTSAASSNARSWATSQREEHVSVRAVADACAVTRKGAQEGSEASLKKLGQVVASVSSWGDADRECAEGVDAAVCEGQAIAERMGAARDGVRAGEEALVSSCGQLLEASKATGERVRVQGDACGASSEGLSEARETHCGELVGVEVAVLELCAQQESALVGQSSSVDAMQGTRPTMLEGLEGLAERVTASLSAAESEIAGLAEEQSGAWRVVSEEEDAKWQTYTESFAASQAEVAKMAQERVTECAAIEKRGEEGVDKMVSVCSGGIEAIDRIVKSEREAVSGSVDSLLSSVRDYASTVIKCDESVAEVAVREELPFSESISRTPPDETILQSFKPSEAVNVVIDYADEELQLGSAGAARTASDPAQLQVERTASDVTVTSDTGSDELSNESTASEPQVANNVENAPPSNAPPAKAPVAAGSKTPAKTPKRAAPVSRFGGAKAAQPKSMIAAPKSRSTLKELNSVN